MRLLNPGTWGQAFLPKWRRVPWTWKRNLMLAFAASVLVDSFFVPFSRGVDPGGAGDGVLFLILAFRAASRRGVSLPVVFIGGSLTALTLALNHRLLRSPSPIWTPLAILLLLVVIFWRPRRGVPHKGVEPPDPPALGTKLFG